MVIAFLNMETVQIFPNPTNGIIQIDLGKNYDELHLSIHNVIGKNIHSTIYNHQNRIAFQHCDQS